MCRDRTLLDGMVMCQCGDCVVSLSLFAVVSYGALWHMCYGVLFVSLCYQACYIVFCVCVLYRVLVCVFMFVILYHVYVLYRVLDYMYLALYCPC